MQAKTCILLRFLVLRQCDVSLSTISSRMEISLNHTWFCTDKTFLAIYVQLLSTVTQFDLKRNRAGINEAVLVIVLVLEAGKLSLILSHVTSVYRHYSYAKLPLQF